MVRNVPPSYSMRSLLEELHGRGFVPLGQRGHEFDFFYLPIDLGKRCNMGYCFMNMVNAAGVQALCAALESQHLRERSRKPLQVVPAASQGYEANLIHFTHSAVLNHHKPEHSPLFLREEPPKKRKEHRLLPPGVTTLRLSPLPPCTQPMLYLELFALGFGQSVDFLHVETDTATVNFVSGAAAQRALGVLHGHQLFGMAIEAHPAPIQGCGPNIVHFASRPAPAPLPDPWSTPMDDRRLPAGWQLSSEREFEGQLPAAAPLPFQPEPGALPCLDGFEPRSGSESRDEWQEDDDVDGNWDWDEEDADADACNDETFGVEASAAAKPKSKPKPKTKPREPERFQSLGIHLDDEQRSSSTASPCFPSDLVRALQGFPDMLSSPATFDTRKLGSVSPPTGTVTPPTSAGDSSKSNSPSPRGWAPGRSLPPPPVSPRKFSAPPGLPPPTAFATEWA
jgi:hypothetical protein